MKQSLKNYRKKIKKKEINFYLKDLDLLNYANSINFQKFVKEALLKEMKGK